MTMMLEMGNYDVLNTRSPRIWDVGWRRTSDGARENLLDVAQAVLQRELALCRAHVARGGGFAGRLVAQAPEHTYLGLTFPSVCLARLEI